jgi:hypothetical protein
VASYFCDPSPGGIQEKIVDVLSTSGEERHTRLAELAQKMRDDVLILGLFEIPGGLRHRPQAQLGTPFRPPRVGQRHVVQPLTPR